MRSTFRERCRSTLLGRDRFLPATAHGLEQVDLAGQLRKAIGDQLLLHAVQLALGVQQRQVVIDTRTVTPLGEPVIIFAALKQAALGLYLAGIGFLRGEAVGYFAEGRLDGLLVLGHLDVLAYPRIVQIGPQLAGIEDRHADAGRKAPVAGTTIEQPGQFAARRTGGTRQADPREERGTGRTDAGIDRPQLVLGLKDVRALKQQI